MLSTERIFYIMNQLNLKSFLTISELMEQMHVSKSTINRDLIELEKQGYIKRERGGAIKTEISETLNTLNEIPVIEKELLHSSAKQCICHDAAQTIQNGDCIYLDSGTTPSYLMEYIRDKNIKIVTPSTYIFSKLPLGFKGEIYLVGGQFIPDYSMSIGYHSLEMIHKFHFDKAFFSTSGIDLNTGDVMSIDFDICAVKKEVLIRSEHNYLLIDDSKLQIRAFATWANVCDFDIIFMNYSNLPPKTFPENFQLCKGENNDSADYK